MFAMMLNWITRSVEAAFLKGFENALAKLGAKADDGSPIEAPVDVSPNLQARFALYAEPIEEARVGRKSKAGA